jgi:Ni/Fe-hydrogenase subunit HybB-like protein
MNGFSWPIFVTVQVLFWIGFACGYDIGKEDKEQQ